MHVYFVFVSWFFCHKAFGQGTLPHDPFSQEEPPRNIVDEPQFLSEFFYMLLMLGMLIGAMFLASWFLKRMANARFESLNSLSNIRIIEKRNLSHKTTLYLIESEGRSILIAESPGALVRLYEKALDTQNESMPTPQL
jgi:flagellar biogenesis protein FliO